MGVEHIDKTKGTFKKGFDKSCEKLATADLFTVEPKTLQIILVEPVGGTGRFAKGVYYVCQEANGEINVYLQMELLGICRSPSTSIISRLIEIGGRASGILR